MKNGDQVVTAKAAETPVASLPGIPAHTGNSCRTLAEMPRRRLRGGHLGLRLLSGILFDVDRWDYLRDERHRIVRIRRRIAEIQGRKQRRADEYAGAKVRNNVTSAPVVRSGACGSCRRTPCMATRVPAAPTGGEAVGGNYTSQ